MLVTLEQVKRIAARLLDKAAAAAETAAGKADKVQVVSLTIPADGWKSDSTAGYPKYADIAVAGLTAADTVALVIEPESADTALAAGMTCTESRAGTLRLRAKNTPAADMKACWYIVR